MDSCQVVAGGNMLTVVVLILMLPSCIWASSQSEMVDKIQVLGVIASKSRSVALIKDERSKKTQAVLLGQKSFFDYQVVAIQKKQVTLQRGSEKLILPVGAPTRVAASSGISNAAFSGLSNASETPLSSGFEKEGNTIRVSTDLRSHLLNNELSKVLMQAAAVPRMENGKIAGFEMWEIEKGSVFEMAGIQNGDVVTMINGHSLTDIPGTIRKLNSLREENSIQVQITRNGKVEELNLLVQ
jgi:type II secretion system protein C